MKTPTRPTRFTWTLIALAFLLVGTASPSTPGAQSVAAPSVSAVVVY